MNLGARLSTPLPCRRDAGGAFAKTYLTAMSTPTTQVKIPTLEEATVLSAEDEAFLREVAAKIRAVETGAELLLYGSRGRGDARTFLELMVATRERWEADRSWLAYFRNVIDDAVAI